MSIEEILNEGSAEKIIGKLKQKQFMPPNWEKLKKEYEPKLHPVYTDPNYRDLTNKDKTIDKVTRVGLAFQKLATKRMTEMCFGIPVKRIYNAQNEKQKTAANVIENIFKRNRIDNINIERGNMLFAGCELMTLWYSVANKNAIYGVESDIKIRCRNFSPMNGDKLYPLFDEMGDYIAMSIEYDVLENEERIQYFETYTENRHLKWRNDTEWKLIIDEEITIGKNPTLYAVRRLPIWENTSDIVYEMEWELSRNGNYLRKNSKPVLKVASKQNLQMGKEKNQDNEFRLIYHVDQGDDISYVTWQQSVDSLKFQIDALKNLFFMQLQLIDFSTENMKNLPMSGEARKQLYIDSQLKVKDEAGSIVEFLDREVNIVKAFAKLLLPEYEKDIDTLDVEIELTPFTINDETETISNLVTASGNKPIISQREAIEFLGWSNDVDKTMQQITEENAMDAAELNY